MDQIEPGQAVPPASEEDKWRYSLGKVKFGITITLVGFLIFLIGIRPSWFGLSNRPGMGFIKLSVFMIGLAIICIGGYLSLSAFWKRGTYTISADIGLRLIATGYLITLFSAMADVFGFGSQPPPLSPSFGRWQASGVEIGQIVIAVGLLLLIPYTRHQHK